MASLKEMRNRIGSVKATQKITKAMQMVAAAKLKRAQDQAESARPYAQKMASVLANLAAGVSGADAPRLLAGTGADQRHLVVVATADKGLAGGFSTNVIRAARERINSLIASGKDVKIVAVGKKAVEVEIEGAREVRNESPLRIVLVQAIARGEKMDWILQKATELGVARILPVMSERSEVKLDAQRADKRLAHWRGIVVSACEQSGRATVPEIAAPQALAQAAAQRAGRGFILDPFADDTLSSLRDTGLRECTIAIGPEGGWSPRDREQLIAAGYEGLRLGPRVLRTETAGIAAIAALQALCGDLG